MFWKKSDAKIYIDIYRKKYDSKSEKKQSLILTKSLCNDLLYYNTLIFGFATMLYWCTSYLGLPQRPASKLKMFQNMSSMNGPGSPTFNNR